MSLPLGRMISRGMRAVMWPRSPVRISSSSLQSCASDQSACATLCKPYATLCTALYVPMHKVNTAKDFEWMLHSTCVVNKARLVLACIQHGSSPLGHSYFAFCTACTASQPTSCPSGELPYCMQASTSLALLTTLSDPPSILKLCMTHRIHQNQLHSSPLPKEDPGSGHIYSAHSNAH